MVGAFGWLLREGFSAIRVVALGLGAGDPDLVPRIWCR